MDKTQTHNHKTTNFENRLSCKCNMRWPGDARSHGISNYGFDLVFLQLLMKKKKFWTKLMKKFKYKSYRPGGPFTNMDYL